MRALVVGLGAMGSVFSLLLSKEYEIGAISRRTGKKKVIVRGKIRGEIEVECFERPKGEYDLVLLAVKSYDLEGAIKSLKIVEGVPVAYLQNGVYADRLLRSLLTRNPLVRIVTSIGAIRTEEGAEVTGIGRTYVGAYSKEGEKYARSLLRVLRAWEIPAFFSEDIWSEVWKKTLANACINPLTAILRVKNGEILREPLLTLAKEIFYEGRKAAEIEGVSVGEFEEIVLPVAESTKENYSSMLQDVISGKRTEIEAINGEIVRVLRSKGEDAPFNRSILLMVKALERYLAGKDLRR